MIGAVYCEIFIYEAQSLKDKRSVIKRITTQLKQRYNVSVAEFDYHDAWQRAKIAIVTVSTDKQIAEKELNKALSLIDRMTEIERTVTNYEWL